ncbi:cyclin-a2-4 [Anaeramoeba flamelloides]|uniref:Cyclin-a2-4 n=1 Tax=Anaeramoeba flamelloides TaxID=1746091 RepID=A0ABQ8XXR0_9EUKA|nr:cyclin-a2-4 [Anaeramoeba flamelloides]
MTTLERNVNNSIPLLQNKRSVLGSLTNRPLNQINTLKQKNVNQEINNCKVLRKQKQPNLGTIQLKQSQERIRKRGEISQQTKTTKKRFRKNQKSKSNPKKEKKKFQQRKKSKKDQKVKKAKTKSHPIDPKEISKITDIHRPFSKLPEHVTEIADEITQNMRIKEKQDHIGEDFLQKQSQVNANMREILVDWLCDVHINFEFKTETLYLTAKLLDKFLLLKPVPINRLQLVGITALLIASKYQEVNTPDIEEFVLVANGAFTLKELLKMEIVMLTVLRFRVTYVSPYFFLQIYLKAAGIELISEEFHTLKFLSNYFLELTLLKSYFRKFCPSKLAASSLYLAIKTLNLNSNSNFNSIGNKNVLHKSGQNSKCWSNTLTHYTKFHTEQIIDCVILISTLSNQLLNFGQSEENQTPNIKKKYSHPDFYSVAMMKIPLIKKN